MWSISMRLVKLQVSYAAISMIYLWKQDIINHTLLMSIEVIGTFEQIEHELEEKIQSNNDGGRPTSISITLYVSI